MTEYRFCSDLQSKHFAVVVLLVGFVLCVCVCVCVRVYEVRGWWKNYTLTLHCHCQNGSCIKTGSYESFSFSFSIFFSSFF